MMAFDEIRLPLRVGYGAKGGPQFSTEVITIAGGYERRNQNWSAARRRYDAGTGVQSVADAAVLGAFFQARMGRARGFRLKDWMDHSSAVDGVSGPHFMDQVIGTGDGVTVLFQLIKNYGPDGAVYQRKIMKPVAASVSLGVGGVALVDGWSVDVTTGLVSFAAAPEAGQTITAGFLFDVPVRFDTDCLAMTMLDSHTEKTEIPLIEVRV